MKGDNQPDRDFKKDNQTDRHTDTGNWTCRAQPHLKNGARIAYICVWNEPMTGKQIKSEDCKRLKYSPI